MSFMERFKQGLARLMSGRHGPDELSLALLIAGLALSFTSSLTGIGLLYLVGLASYGFSFFRILSRRIDKRQEENAKFLGFWHNFTGNARHALGALKITTELLFQNAIDELGLLLFTKLHSVFAFLAAAAGLADRVCLGF